MFYIYVYRDPRPEMNMQPVYVGKGSGGRSKKHLIKGLTKNKAFGVWLTKLRTLNLRPEIQVVFKSDDESSVYAKEIELIEIYGRRNTNTGMLFNLTAGGPGANGVIWTDESRSKRSAAMSTPEGRAKNSERALKYWANPGFREVISVSKDADGKRHYRSNEFRDDMSVIGKARWRDTDYRQRVTEAMREAAARPDVRAMRSANTKAAWADPVAHAARAAAIKASRTPELRAQLSASCSALWDDERRAAQSAKMKVVLASPEMKAQRSAVMTARWARARKNKESTP